MDSLTELFCLIDDFEPALQKRLLEQEQRKRRRQAGLCLSELLTLVVLFHQLRYRQFKAFYWHHVRTHLRQEFPRLPSCQRCVALMPRCAIALTALFELLKGQCTGLSVADLTSLASIIETVFDELKNLCQIEHTRHRSIANFMVNLMAGIIAYCLSPNKPRIPVSAAQTLLRANQTELIQN